MVPSVLKIVKPLEKVTQSCLTLCDPIDWSTPGFPVLHCLLEIAQIHVHWVKDAIQPSHPCPPFSSCLQPFSAAGSFPVSWLFTSGDQIIGASAWVSVLSMSIQGWLPLGLTDLLAVYGTSQESSLAPQLKASILQHSAFLMVQLSHLYMTTGKTTWPT